MKRDIETGIGILLIALAFAALLIVSDVIERHGELPMESPVSIAPHGDPPMETLAWRATDGR